MRSTAALLSILVTVAVAHAATINVPADYPTIQAAIDAANPAGGDVIQVAPGTHYAPGAGGASVAFINKPLTLVSTAGPAATIIDGNSEGEHYYVVDIKASNVVLDGFTITNPIYNSTADVSGVLIGMQGGRPTNVRITNCIIRDLGAPSRTAGYGSFAINSGGVNGLEVDHCEIHDITHNITSDGWVNAMMIWGNDSSQPAENVSIHDNNIHDLGSPAAYDAGICISSDTRDVSISGNIITGAGEYGVTSSPESLGGIVISDNQITGATLAGILCRNPYADSISGNALSGNVRGLLVTKYGSITPAGPTVQNNDLSGNTVAGVDNQVAEITVDATQNWWGNPSGPYHASLNPGGTGSPVSDHVDFDPWLSSCPIPRTLVVDDDGQASATDCDATAAAYTSINAAIADANPGDTIHVCPGTFSERVNVTKSLTLTGAQSGVDPAAANARTNPLAESIITEAGLVDPNPNVLIDIPAGVQGVTIDGFTLIGDPIDSDADTSVVCCATTTNIRISNNIISGRFGILFKGGSNLQALSNRVTHNTTGILVQPNPASDVSVIGNKFNKGSAPASDARPLYFTNVTRGEVARNTGANFPGEGMAGSNLSEFTITGNQFTGCKKGFSIWGTTTFVSIEGNTITGSLLNGIDIKGQDIEIVCNAVMNNGGSGIRIAKHMLETQRVTIADNGVSGNGTYAIEVAPEVTETVNARNNWWNANDAAVIGAMMSGNVDYTSWLTKPPVCSMADVVYLVPTDESLYVKLTDSVVVDVNVANLQQAVAGLQAMLHFSSSFFSAAPADVAFAPGGGVWNEAVGYVYGDPAYQGSGVAGDLDTIALVNTSSGSGTTADLKAAYVTLKPIAEGMTQIVFRADGIPDTKQTVFTVIGGGAVYPAKVDSTRICIDSTLPTVAISAATQSGDSVLNGAKQIVEGTVNVAVTASDALAGLAANPVVTVSSGADTLPVTFVNESPAGTFNYTAQFVAGTPAGTWTIAATATDRAGNVASSSGTLCFDRKITGTVELQSLLAPSGGLTRTVTFVATGGVSKTWNIPVTFAAGTTGTFELAGVPSGTTGLSAKTAWNLRRKVAVTLIAGQAEGVNFTGSSSLLGGDLNDTNSVNVLDYGLLKGVWGLNSAGDINGDGISGTLDYAIMKTNWFKVGDPQ